MIPRAICLLVCCFTLIVSHGQSLGYHFIEGWTSSTSYQVEDSLLTVSIRNVVPGVEGSGRHRILLTKSTLDWSESREVVFNYDTAYVTTHFNASDITSKSLMVCGSYSPSLGIDTQTAYLAQFDLNGNLLRKRSFNFGVSNQCYSIIHTRDGNIAVVGVYNSNRAPLRAFFLLVDSALITLEEKTYGCNDFNSNGGCNMYPHQITESNDGNFIITLSAYAVQEPEIRYPIVNKIKPNGDVIWSYDAEETTFSYNYPLSVETNQGNHFLFALKNVYNPYQNPDLPGNRLPTQDSDGSSFVIELSPLGIELGRRDLRAEVLKYYNDQIDYNVIHFGRAIKTNDGGFALCGNNYVENEVGYEAGFLMKLDSEGDVSWFRRYQVDSATPYDTNQKQKTYVYGLSQLDNGGYAFSGRYISPPAPEFDGGPFNSALSIITDEYGCVKSGCQDVVGIAEVEDGMSLTLRPNPSQGSFTVPLIKEAKVISLLNTKGEVLQQLYDIKESRVLMHTDVPSGLYFLKIYYSSGTTETRKVVISR